MLQYQQSTLNKSGQMKTDFFKMSTRTDALNYANLFNNRLWIFFYLEQYSMIIFLMYTFTIECTTIWSAKLTTSLIIKVFISL